MFLLNTTLIVLDMNKASFKNMNVNEKHNVKGKYYLQDTMTSALQVSSTMSSTFTMPVYRSAIVLGHQDKVSCLKNNCRSIHVKGFVKSTVTVKRCV